MKKTLLNVLALAVTCASVGLNIQNNQKEAKNIFAQNALGNNEVENGLFEKTNNDYIGDNSDISLPKLAKRNAISELDYNCYTDNKTYLADDLYTAPNYVQGKYVRIIGNIERRGTDFSLPFPTNLPIDPFDLIFGADQDWFQITFRYKARHYFTFTAPNDAYRFAVAGYRGSSQPEELAVETGSSNFSIVLDAGTYFFHFSAENPNQIIETQFYELKTHYVIPDEPPADVCPPYSDYFKMALWVNDMVPDLHYNRWSNCLHSIRQVVGDRVDIDGYVDPLFKNEGQYLDSVLFVWDKPLLRTLAAIFEKMPLAIRKTVEDEYLAKLHDLEVRYVRDRFEFWAGQIPIVGDIISGFSEARDTIEGALEIANMIAQGPDTSLLEKGLAIGRLAEACKTAAYSSELQCVCIPRFAEVFHDECGSVVSDSWQGHTIDNFYRYKNFETYDVSNPTHWLDIQSDYSIHQFQKMWIMDSNGLYPVQEKEYHGSVEVFRSTRDLSNYMNLDLFTEYGFDMPEDPIPDIPTPVDPTPTFPKVTKTKTTDFVWFDPNSFVHYSGHGQDWYEADITIPSGIPQSEWDSINFVDCGVWSFSNIGSYYGYYNYNGTFIVHITSRDQYTFGGVTVTFTYETEQRLQSLSRTGSYKTTFRIGEEFNADGLRIIANYSSGDSKAVTGYAVDSSAYNPNVKGSYPIKIIYTEAGITKTHTYTVWVINHDLTDIALSGNYQTTFNAGDEFNYDDLVVTAFYANGAVERVTGFTVTTNADMNTPGTYSATVSYKENGITMNRSYYFVVEEFIPALESIEISGDYQFVFNAGDEFNYDDLVVTAYYENGTSKILEGFVVDLYDVDLNTPGTYSVNVSYTENGITAETWYEITVIALENTLSSINLSGSYKKIYSPGDELDLSGLIVTAQYFGQPDQIVTDYEVDTSDVDMNEQGTHTITISYTEGGVTKTASFTILILKSTTKPWSGRDFGDLIVVRP